MIEHLSTIEMISVEALHPSARNARTHSKRQLAQIVRSIERFGFANPILIDDHLGIIAGHGRWAAAKALGLAKIPCLRLSGMSEAERRAYAIADNKLGLQAGWDGELLAQELVELSALEIDIELTGFDQAEVDIIIDDAAERKPSGLDRDDVYPAVPEPGAITSVAGDIWDLGRHRLACGNIKDPWCVDRLMAGEQAAMVFTDPPYNVPNLGHVGGLGRIKHREFSEAHGEMDRHGFTEFLTASFFSLERCCRNGALAYTCMDWRHLPEILAAGEAVFSELKQLCVWSKTNGGMGTFYRSQHELVLVWKVGDAPHVNNFGLGDRGRYRTNVWSYPGVNAFRPGRLQDLALHPTLKPVALVADAIRDVTARGDIVLDGFGGAGTTLLAAEKTGRSARLIEIDGAYCDVAVERWQKLTGKPATLQSSGETFEVVRMQRTGSTLVQERAL